MPATLSEQIKTAVFRRQIRASARLARMAWAPWMEMRRLDELAAMDTPMHRLDPRAKAVATLFYIVVVMSFPKGDLAALMPLVLYPLTLLVVGRIPFGPICRKILWAAPFALAVGIWNPLLDRRPAMELGAWTLTAGWVSFTSILVRFVLTASAALALVSCTGMPRLVAGLERMGWPRVFAVQLLFLYRYLFVVMEEGMKMLQGLVLRGARPEAVGWRIYGALTGHLLLRSINRAGRIHQAMVARGFTGEIRVLRQRAGSWRDIAFVAGWGIYFCVVRQWNLADWVGSWTLEVFS